MRYLIHTKLQLAGRELAMSVMYRYLITTDLTNA